MAAIPNDLHSLWLFATMKSEPLGMRENKSGEFFPQYFASGFGENFPWRKFPAIR